jgi:adenylate kinase
MLNLIIFGPPGSGKGTQSARIVERYNLIHLSTGDILREEIQKGTPLGQKVKTYIDKGLLVPDELVLKELFLKAKEHMGGTGFIFDGFPRTIVQAEMLDKALEKRNTPVNLVISVEVDEDELFKRLSGRAEDSGRSDDTADIIRKRIEVYKKQSMPLISYYRKQGRIVCVNGMDPVDKVFGKITFAIDTYLSKKEVVPEVG